MTDFAATTVLPLWVALPMGVMTMIAIAAHLISLESTAMSSRRRRIRQTSGTLLMAVAALMTYALGGTEMVNNPAADPAAAGRFLQVWLAIVALLLIVVALAVMDVGQTAREAFLARGRLRLKLRQDLECQYGQARTSDRPAKR